MEYWKNEEDRMQETGGRIQKKGPMLDAGSWILDSECWKTSDQLTVITRKTIEQRKRKDGRQRKPA
jgi:hypothetical protein